jgi:hypothetical protein
MPALSYESMRIALGIESSAILIEGLNNVVARVNELRAEEFARSSRAS